jgi:hypothetical protein
MVQADLAFPHRANEEDRPLSSSAPGVDSQLFAGRKADSGDVVEGLNN